MDPIIRDVSFKSNDERLSGRTYQPPGGQSSKPGLLFVHGLHSNQEGYHVRATAAATALDTVCLTFDLSGHGRSTGQLDNLTPHDHLTTCWRHTIILSCRTTWTAVDSVSVLLVTCPGKTRKTPEERVRGDAGHDKARRGVRDGLSGGGRSLEDGQAVTAAVGCSPGCGGCR